MAHLAGGLARRGHEVRLMALADAARGTHAARRHFEEQGVDFVPVPHSRSVGRAAARAALGKGSVYGGLVRNAALAGGVERQTQRWADLIQCEFSYMAQYLPPGRARGGPLRVLDAHNVESRLAGTGRPDAGRAYHLYAAWERTRRLAEEREACRRADVVLTVSADDASTFDRLFTPRCLRVVPNGVAVDEFAPDGRPEAARTEGIVFVGKLDYGPNVDGVLWFAREVWPRVRQHCPTSTWTVVGLNPTSDVVALNDIPGVRVTGEVPDVRPFLNEAALVVVPLRSGSGTRLKVLEAMAMGRPIVTTSMGAEGIAASDAALRRCDEAHGMADTIVALLADPAARQRLAEAARAEVAARYSWPSVLDALEDAYARV